jgi:hypothetical protein
MLRNVSAEVPPRVKVKKCVGGSPYSYPEPH